MITHPRSVPSARCTEPHTSGSEEGFSLIETLVTMLLLVGVVAGALDLFDGSNKLARTGTHVAGMQQALRSGQYELMRMVRMAGRGGIQQGPLPQGLAVAIRNNTPTSGDERYISVGDSDSPQVLAGTDVLTVRGAIASSIYQINPLGGGLILDAPQTPTSGSIRVRNPHPTTGVPQDLGLLIEAVENETHAALLLVSPLDIWTVVEIDSTASDVTSDPADIQIGFKIGTVTGTTIVDYFTQLSGGFPIGLRSAAHIALLEEYRYYVREEYAVEGDDESALVAKLVKARYYPNTEVPHPSDPALGAEVSDNVVDLQVALGIDLDGNGSIIDGAVEPTVTLRDDEWLFNSQDDVNGDGDPIDPERWNPIGSAPDLYYLRINTLARTDRPDRGYLAPILTEVEDNDYSSGEHDRFNDTDERRYRRRLLSTVVDLRNL